MIFTCKIYFVDSKTDIYQTYAFTFSVWMFNILVMIISLTCLLISDPIIYSDSEAYNDYVQVRKRAENSFLKVIKIKKCLYLFVSVIVS